jgi:hypothetical protein
MPSYSKLFESVISNNAWDNPSGLLPDGTGVCDAEFNGSIMVLDAGYDSNSFPTNATFTGIRITVTASTISTQSTLKITPKIGATAGDTTTINPSTNNFTFLIGGSSNLLGLTLTPSSFPFLRVEYNLTDANSTITQISATSIRVYYTLPFSNRIYNTSGKLSITSGKVSLT